MEITRRQIIAVIKEKLENNSSVYALWLEGTYSLNATDQYSDIDMVADVKDGDEEKIMEEIEATLKSMGDLDFNYQAPRPNQHLRYKIFHITGTSEHWLIDVNIQSHSRDFSFVESDNYEKPSVLFDKADVIKFKKLDRSALNANIQKRILDLEADFYQRSKVKKYILRKKYLETLALYHQDVLKPLVELLRIKYTYFRSSTKRHYHEA
jgi:hypothetical protein